MELGFAWAPLKAGAAMRLVDQTWIYTAPPLGNRGARLAVEVPVAASIRVFDGLMLLAEYRVSWAGELSYDQQRHVETDPLAVPVYCPGSNISSTLTKPRPSSSFTPCPSGLSLKSPATIVGISADA